MSKNRLIQAFEDAALALLGSKQASIILAVSGGCDSMVMASLFLACGFRSLSIAHVNFGLRGTESDADEALVRDWAKEKQIPFYVRRCDTHAYADEHRLSIEMAARELRYAWFAALLQETGASYVALAHHANDSAETMLLNLVRGSGLRGLCGIPVQRGAFIRPMLDFERKALEAYAKKWQIPYRTDASNTSLIFSRNRIRQKVWPQLQQISPALTARMRENARYLSQAQEILDAQLQERKKVCCRQEGDSLFIDLVSLEQDAHAAYWLFAILQPYGFSSAQMETVLSLLRTQPGHRLYTSQYTLYRDRDCLCLRPHTEAGPLEPLRLQYYAAADYTRGNNLRVAALDADALREPLLLRKWAPGDRFCPLGMRGYKKVSDFLIDAKAPLWEKEQQWVLCCGEDIVWLVGRRIDERYKLREGTITVAEFQMTEEA